MPTENLAPMDALSEKEKIQILLSEYTAVRTEIVSRTGYSFQIGVVVAAVITWLLQQPPITWQVAIGLAVVALFVLWFSLLNIRDTWRVADRIKELEHEINSRAGEHLLVWERLWGAARMGFFPWIFSRIEPLPRSTLPPLDRYRKQPQSTGPQPAGSAERLSTTRLRQP